MVSFKHVVLLLIIKQLKWSSQNRRTCSDNDSLDNDLNGKIFFIPGPAVLTGTNVTLLCTGIDGRRTEEKTENPRHIKIDHISLFGPSSQFIKTCRFFPESKKRKECNITLPGKLFMDGGSFNYTCVFNSGFTKCAYSASKNLTITKNECLAYPRPCHVDGKCIKTQSSFKCECNNGFSGDGEICVDIPECSSTSACHPDAYCTELLGSYNCTCKDGFTGNGSDCRPITTAIPEDREGSHKSDSPNLSIILGVAGGFLALSLSLFGFLCYKHRGKIEEVTSKIHSQVEEGEDAHKDNLGMALSTEKMSVRKNFARKKLPSIRDHNNIEEHNDEDVDILSYICVLDDWEVERARLTILHKKLGGGQFGVVTKGLYNDKENGEIEVAVKMLKGTKAV